MCIFIVFRLCFSLAFWSCSQRSFISISFLLLPWFFLGGGIHRLHDACLEKLLQHPGWKDQLVELARQVVADSSSHITVEDLTNQLIPVGKSSIPIQLNEELRELVHQSIRNL